MSGNPEADNASEIHASTRSVDVLRISTAGEPPKREQCSVVVEELVTLTIDDVGSYMLMCTPCDLKPFAVGFLFSEGLIGSADDIAIISICDDDPNAVRVRLLEPPTDLVSRRNLIVASSCGMCGTTDIETILSGLEAAGDTLKVPGSLLNEVAGRMHSSQKIFAHTGGTHAAGIFSSDGEIIALAEDLGRHNALDKAVGKCLLTGVATQGCGAALSGRVSLELATKAARAGIELIAAVSAPTSLAIEVANRCNITLCGFVRPGRASIYTHRRRITDAAEYTGEVEKG